MKTFAQFLEETMDTRSVNVSDLAKATGLDRSTIYRYRKGIRIPEKESDSVEKLAEGIVTLSQEESPVSTKDLTDRFNELIKVQREEVSFDGISDRFSVLIDEMDIRISHLAEHISYDTSQVYRIRSGIRRPGNPNRFVEDVASYTISTLDTSERLRTASTLIGYDRGAKIEPEMLFTPMCNWLLCGRSHDETMACSALDMVDAYDINDYIKVPFPTSEHEMCCKAVIGKRDYFGEKAIEEATEGFLASIVNSRSLKTIICYSEFTSDMYEDSLKKSALFMRHIADLIQRGVHVITIHNVNRSFESMIMDFIMWIPLFMSGNITPYYLDDINMDLPRFRYCSLVAGNAALIGEGIASDRSTHHAKVTTDKEEVRFYRRQNERLLEKAMPLAEIIDERGMEYLHEFLGREAEVAGNRLIYLFAPPIYTISDGLLDSILRKNNVDEKTVNRVKSYVREKRGQVKRILSSGTITALISSYSEQEFCEGPPALFLSEIFIKDSIKYDYGDYMAHFEQTRRFAEKNENFHFMPHANPGYRNIRILIHRERWAIVSTNKGSGRHAIIRHPKLVYKMENSGEFSHIKDLFINGSKI